MAVCLSPSDQQVVKVDPCNRGQGRNCNHGCVVSHHACAESSRQNLKLTQASDLRLLGPRQARALVAWLESATDGSVQFSGRPRSRDEGQESPYSKSNL
ncbi:hypothetical protein PoB_005451700 [Plakobranchus ocellatus]|uniref:Uncharacterized protein n=1 Tax=Plakobranchus ocellatus TaxID=259542 RepID=A0AAV4C9H9_9GAST|nr:hypothetical protein PoB_005451700 [Plakobranchus ocellatus]